MDPILDLSPHELNKMINFKKVRLEDFDLKQFEKLCHEGKLYVSLESDTDTNAYGREVLDYVRRINAFATEDWEGNIDNLWNAIVEAPCFKDILMMKNGVQRGHINKYSVTNLVCRMQNAGVYRQDVSMLSLHLKLEGVEKKNKYYKSSGNYDLSREAKAFLKQLLQGV
jgi:hypothetical protein